jgi:hypothetical protein
MWFTDLAANTALRVGLCAQPRAGERAHRNIASHNVKAGDDPIRDKRKSRQLRWKSDLTQIVPANWLTADRDALSSKVARIPREDAADREQQPVELYSR